MLGHESKHGSGTNKGQKGSESLTVLFLATLLGTVALQSVQKMSAAEQPSLIASDSNNIEKKSPAVANHRLQQQYWRDFLTLEEESWHYDYNKTEMQNLEAYQKWYCTDLRAQGYKDFTHVCDSLAYPKDDMWQYEQLRDEILWNKANHQPHHEIKKTDEQMRYMEQRAEMRVSMSQNEKAGNTTWHHYLSLEKQAWHYDYTRKEWQNLNVFQNWWYGKGGPEDVHKMWFSEQYGREILWNKASSLTEKGSSNNNGDENNTNNLPRHHKSLSPNSQIQLWFEEEYRQHNADILKYGCINPWERTPTNASPSWSACLEAKGYSPINQSE